MNKAIKCPNCGGLATLYCWPHELAGIWQCDSCETSDSCEHKETEEKSIEVDTMRNGEHDTYETKMQECLACRSEVEYA
jgi:hypothetical protein